MNRRAGRPDESFNPYEPPRAPLGPAEPQAKLPPGLKKDYAVTHDLTDQELKRFVNFDVYYDPKPLFGFLPQWVVVAVMAAFVGSVIGSQVERSTRSIVLGALIGPTASLGILDLIAAARRRHARTLGLCDGRTVTITPRGLSVQIPDARSTSLIGIGPTILAWRDIRRISVNDDDLTFWFQPTMADMEGRARIIVPLRVFAGPMAASAFETAARSWHAAATGADPSWLNESER